VAWTEFQASRRGALHAPVNCRLRLFHAHAGMILERVLAAMERLLDERLGEGDGSHRVIDFPGKDAG